MKLLPLILLATCAGAFAQPSYWFQQFQKQGNAKLAQEYQFRAGTNITFTYTNPPSPYVYINATGGSGGTNSGPPGPPGPPGTNGLNGANGTNGLNGINGTNGLPGLNGTNGVNGINGTNGTNGVNGTNGLPGASGTNSMTVSTNTVFVLPAGVTNLDFDDGTNFHFSGTYSGQTVHIGVTWTRASPTVSLVRPQVTAATTRS